MPTQFDSDPMLPEPINDLQDLLLKKGWVITELTTSKDVEADQWCMGLEIRQIPFFDASKDLPKDQSPEPTLVEEEEDGSYSVTDLLVEMAQVMRAQLMDADFLERLSSIVGEQLITHYVFRSTESGKAEFAKAIEEANTKVALQAAKSGLDPNSLTPDQLLKVLAAVNENPGFKDVVVEAIGQASEAAFIENIKQAKNGQLGKKQKGKSNG